MVDYYGEEGDVYDSYKDTSHLWAYVSHFHNVPFYVYSYAFADLVVGALWRIRQTTRRFRREVVGFALRGRHQRVCRSAGTVWIRSVVGYFLERRIDGAFRRVIGRG